MVTKRKKILAFGMSYFMKELVKNIIEQRPFIVVDSNPLIKEDWKNYENATVFIGDANSIVLWKKLPLKEISHIVFSLPDDDVASELCRIAREIFHLDIPIIAVAHGKERLKSYYDYNISSVDPLTNGIVAVRGLIQTNYAIASNIGLGKGELVEVTIVRKSHLVDRKLKHMVSDRWHVAAIYRAGKLILPTPESKLAVGDKVLIVGHPEVLSGIVNILMQGVPRFPLQYGSWVNVIPDKEALAVMEEGNYLRFSTQAVGIRCYGNAELVHRAEKKDVIASMNPEYITIPDYKAEEAFSDAGLVIIETPKEFSWLNRRIAYFMHKSPSPVLLSKGSYPYLHILVCLNSINSGGVLRIALELSRLTGALLKTVYTAPPKALRNAEKAEELAATHRMIREYEGIERLKIDHTTLEGNPVIEFTKFAGDYAKALVVAGNNRAQGISPFEPNIPFLLAGRLASSVLAIPVDYRE